MPKFAKPKITAPPPNLIIWDWNGTLLDDVAAAVAAINVLLAERGLALESVGQYRERFGFPVENYYAALGFDLAGEEWDRVARDYHNAYLRQPNLRPFADAEPTLAALARQGMRQTLLSACEQSILDRLLSATGLYGYFTLTYGADNLYGRSKAARGRALLEALGGEATATMLIGDTLHDYEVATALGCRCVLVARGHQTRRRLHQAGCPVLESLADLPRLLFEEIA